MKTFSRDIALKAHSWGLLLVLVLLVATPIRSTIIIAALIFYSAGYLIANRASLFISVLDWWVILLLCTMLIGRIAPFILGDFSARYLSSGLHMAASIPIYLTLRHAIGCHELSRFRGYLEWGVVVASISGSLLALYQTQWLGLPRADGFLFSINFGYLNTMLFGMGLALIPHSQQRLWLLLAVFAALVAVMLSGTRGAMLVLPVLLVLFLFLKGSLLGLRRSVGMISGVVAFMVVAYHAVPMVESRVDRGVDEITALLEGDLGKNHSSSGYRANLWMAAWEAFKQRPLVGLTYAERETLNQTLVEAGEVVPWVATVSRGHAHSQYFEMLATGGVIGLTALLGYLIVPALYHSYCVIRQPGNDFALAGVMLTASVAVCGLTEVLLQQEMIAAVYAYLQALLLVLSRSESASS